MKVDIEKIELILKLQKTLQKKLKQLEAVEAAPERRKLTLSNLQLMKPPVIPESSQEMVEKAKIEIKMMMKEFP